MNAKNIGIKINYHELAKIRYIKGMTVKEVSEATNLSPKTIIDLEKGRHVPTPTTMKRLCSHYGIDAATVVSLA